MAGFPILHGPYTSGQLTPQEREKEFSYRGWRTKTEQPKGTYQMPSTIIRLLLGLISGHKPLLSAILPASTQPLVLIKQT